MPLIHAPRQATHNKEVPTPRLCLIPPRLETDPLPTLAEWTGANDDDRNRSTAMRGGIIGGGEAAIEFRRRRHARQTAMVGRLR